ncbi:MAG: NAD(P)/FAD-dependent oxidoreductase [Methanosarcinales archaeon]|nr:NAD(P)/FAD-dependent oxidoreductase [Methanosarcinales archaeon]
MECYDVAVVGAGPAGAMAARTAARAGASTVVLEEHRSVGFPVQCAGLLGVKALEEADLPSGSWRMGSLRGATVHSPGGCLLSFKARSVRAWTVDRRLFDRAMALEAVRAGAELWLRASVRSRRFDGQSLLELGDGRTVRATVVISAEGVKARTARLAGIAPPEIMLSGAQVEVPFSIQDREMVEVHLGAGGARGLFGWVIPCGDGSARVGLCARENACRHLRKFLASPSISRRMKGSPLNLNLGGLPLGPPRSTVAPGILAVGDAAGQVKPTSGGGVYPGLVCARIAGEVAAAAAVERDCSESRLSEYEERWRLAIGRELSLGMRLNRALCSMTDGDMDELVNHLASREDLIHSIEVLGDIDRPSVLAARLIPRLGAGGLRMAGILGRAFLK